MKLTTNNILRVLRNEYNGVPYNWFVILKSKYDSRDYINHDESGRTTVSEYPASKLPLAVQRFISNREAKLRCESTYKETETWRWSGTFSTYVYEE